MGSRTSESETTGREAYNAGNYRDAGLHTGRRRWHNARARVYGGYTHAAAGYA